MKEQHTNKRTTHTHTQKDLAGASHSSVPVPNHTFAQVADSDDAVMMRIDDVLMY